MTREHDRSGIERDRGPDEVLAPFLDVLRKRASLPPALAPQMAAVRIGARIREEERSRRHGWIVAISTCAILAVAIGFFFLVPRHALRAPSAAPSASVPQPLADAREEVVVWIDDETPLYMTVGSSEPASEKGEGP